MHLPVRSRPDCIALLVRTSKIDKATVSPAQRATELAELSNIPHAGHRMPCACYLSKLTTVEISAIIALVYGPRRYPR
jgi:hypothetical protein